MRDQSRAGAADDGGVQGDRGFTLAEVLVGVMVTSLMMAVLASAVIVVSRQSVGSSARVDTARTEQLINTTMPADLASYDTYSTDPGASPCNGSCPAGTSLTGSSNALLLTWTTNEVIDGSAQVVTTNVSYRYTRVSPDYELRRIECRIVGAQPEVCTKSVAGRALRPPPSGVFSPDAKPTWAVKVTQVSDGSGGGTYDAKQALQVVVKVMDESPGAGPPGEPKAVTFTVGSADRKTVTPDSPGDDLTFGEPPSRCSGTIGVIVDTSASIDTQLPTVKKGVADMLNAFRGTPVRIQLVNFGGRAYTSSPDGTWPYWWDMMDQAQVNTLIGSDARGGLVNDFFLTGGTNWEDALFRIFKTKNNTAQTVKPDRIVFFTDGEPYGHMALRDVNSSTGDVLPYDPLDEPFMYSGDAPSLEPRLDYDKSIRMLGFHRAARLLDQFDSDTKVVMVGVGPMINNNIPWVINEGGYHMSGSTKVFSPPYTAYQRKDVTYKGAEVLRMLLQETNNPVVEPRVRADGSYDTSVDATFYPVPDFAKMGAALRAVAIGQCGGTLTMQTRKQGALYDKQITYTSTQTTKTVTTNATKPNGTFDYDLGGSGKEVVITPEPSPAARASEQPGQWKCMSGSTSFVPTKVNLPNTVWDAVKMTITPAGAISCTLELVPL